MAEMAIVIFRPGHEGASGTETQSSNTATPGNIRIPIGAYAIFSF